jgi:broad specificity phosphatase PhoE
MLPRLIPLLTLARLPLFPACEAPRVPTFTTPSASMDTAAPGRVVVTSAPATTSATHLREVIAARALIVVRHADINVADKRTLGSKAPLTTRGTARAATLVAALKDAGITRIYTSETLRTQQTAAALAAALHLIPESPFTHSWDTKAAAASTAPAVPSGKREEAVAVVSYLATHARPEDTILVIHHHSVIPHILAHLGFPKEPDIAEDTEFDRVYVLLPNLSARTYRLLRLRYADQPTP